eukprot:403338352
MIGEYFQNNNANNSQQQANILFQNNNFDSGTARNNKVQSKEMLNNSVTIRAQQKSGLDLYNKSFQDDMQYNNNYISNELMPFVIQNRENKSISSIRNHHKKQHRHLNQISNLQPPLNLLKTSLVRDQIQNQNGYQTFLNNSQQLPNIQINHHHAKAQTDLTTINLQTDSNANHEQIRNVHNLSGLGSITNSSGFVPQFNSNTRNTHITTTLNNNSFMYNSYQSHQQFIKKNIGQYEDIIKLKDNLNGSANKVQNYEKANKLMQKSYREIMDKVRKQGLKYNLNESQKFNIKDNQLNQSSQSDLDALTEQSSIMASHVAFKNIIAFQEMEQKRIRKISKKLDEREILVQNSQMQDTQEAKDLDYQEQNFKYYYETFLSFFNLYQQKQSIYSQDFLFFIQRLMSNINDCFTSTKKAVEYFKDVQQQELQKLKNQLKLRDIEILRIKSLLIDQTDMFSEENRKELENQVSDYLGNNSTSINAALMTKDDIRDQLNSLLEQTNYSGAQSTLTEVHTFLNIQKQFAKDVPIEASINGDQRAILETNNILMHDLAQDLDCKFKDTQRQTARKIMQRFLTKKETQEQSCQTINEEEIIESLKQQLQQKQDLLQIQRDDLVNMTFQNKAIQEQLNQKLAKIESLYNEMKKINRQNDDLREHIETDKHQIIVLKNQISDMNEDKYDQKKRIDEQMDEILKLEEQVFNLKKQIRQLAATGLINAEEIVEVQGPPQLKKFDPKNPNRNSNQLDPFYNPSKHLREPSIASLTENGGKSEADNSYNDEEDYGNEEEEDDDALSAYNDKKRKSGNNSKQNQAQQQLQLRNQSTLKRQNFRANNNQSQDQTNLRKQSSIERKHGESIGSIGSYGQAVTMKIINENQEIIEESNLQIKSQNHTIEQTQRNQDGSLNNTLRPINDDAQKTLTLDKDDLNRKAGQKIKVELKQNNRGRPAIQENKNNQPRINQQSNQNQSQPPVQRNDKNKQQQQVQNKAENRSKSLESDIQQLNHTQNQVLNKSRNQPLGLNENHPHSRTHDSQTQLNQNSQRLKEGININQELQGDQQYMTINDKSASNTSRQNMERELEMFESHNQMLMNYNNQSNMYQNFNNNDHGFNSTFSNNPTDLMPKLYQQHLLNQENQVILKKYKLETEQIEQRIDNYDQQRVGKNSVFQRDEAIQCTPFELNVQLQKSVITQTTVQGDIFERKQVKNMSIQVNNQDLDKEEKREMLYIKNIEKLYASVKKTIQPNGQTTSMGDQLFQAGFKGNYSPQRQMIQSKLNEVGSVTMPPGSNTNKKANEFKVQVKNAIGGGDAFTKIDSERNQRKRQQNQEQQLFENDDHFRSIKLQ